MLSRISQQSSILWVFIISIFSGCDDPEPRQDYFPLTKRSQHFQEHFLLPNFDPSPGSPIVYDTAMGQLASVTFREDTVIGGRKYTIASSSAPRARAWLFVRKRGQVVLARTINTYNRAYVSDEFVLLDPTLPEGSSWVARDSQNLFPVTEFIIKKKDASVSLFGMTYNDVIIVEELYEWGDNTKRRGLRYYQRNKGEIYSELPSHLSGYYADILSVLVE